MGPGDLAIVGASNLGDRMKLIAYWIWRGYTDPWSHEWVIKIIREPSADFPNGLPSKADLLEIQRVFAALSWPNVRYTFHPRGADRFQTLRQTVETRQGDCLPVGTKLLRDDGELIGIEDATPGTVIMGDGRWTTVTNQWAKGPKKLLAFELNNGTVLRCTPDHKLFVVPRTTTAGHPTNARIGTSGRREWAREVRAADVRIGDDLLSPERIPLTRESDDSDVDLAWLTGAFVADGWIDPSKGAINVAGRDASARKSQGGKRNKEEQKRRVQAIADRYGYKSEWGPKSILVRSPEWFDLMARAGRGAPNKRVPTLRMGEAQTVALLDGLSADGGWAGSTFVYSTTSPMLTTQLRALWKSLGRSVGVVRIEDHGGFGRNPIHRVHVRGSGGGKTLKTYPRVRAIRELPAEETWDIETDTHRFWLPDNDVTVHNCDCACVAFCTALHILGFKVGARIYSSTGKAWDHIVPIVGLPREASSPLEVLVLETTGGPGGTPESAKLGWEVPVQAVAAYRDFWFDLNGTGG